MAIRAAVGTVGTAVTDKLEVARSTKVVPITHCMRGREGGRGYSFSHKAWLSRLRDPIDKPYK